MTKNKIDKVLFKIKELYLFRILKKRWKIASVCALIFFLFLGYFLGRINTSREYVLAQLEMSLKNSDASKLNNIVKINEKKVSEKSLQPLVKYYKDNRYKIDNLINRLKSTSQEGYLKVESKKYLFWDIYYIEIDTCDLTINSNYENAEFTVGNIGSIKSGETISNVIPGSYSIHGLLENKYGDITTEKNIVVSDNSVIKLDFPAQNINITSDFEDADIYINDEYTNIKVKDANNIGPFPIDGSVKIHIERDFPWGRIKGEDVSITDNPNIVLSISMENDTLKENINVLIDEFYDSVFKALNDGDKNLIKRSNNETKDKIYESIKTNYFILKNKYENIKIDTDFQNTQYYYKDGVYKATVVVNVDYTVSKKILGINKKEYSKSFFTNIIFSNDKWMVEDVNNFSI